MLKKVLVTGMLAAMSQLSLAADYQTVASYDLGSLDTLAELGLAEKVVGVPKQNLPAYLATFSAPAYADIGGLKQPNLTELKALEPDLVIIGGRQAGQKEDIEAFATVHQVDGTDANHSYWSGVSTNIKVIAAGMGEEAKAENALDQLKQALDADKRKLQALAATALVVTHNGGRFVLRTEPVVSELLGLSAPALPANAKPEQRGTRTFTPLSVAQIAKMKPTVLLVVDRSAAVNDTDNAVDKNALEQALAAESGQEIKVGYLTPKLWYLSGGGLQSLRLQSQEVVQAFTQ